MRVSVLIVALATSLLWPAAAQARKSELILFETKGCVYCKVWLRDVAPGYSASPYGNILPLRRIDLSKGVSGDDRDLLPVNSVPTFVIRACNREMGRIVGYSGKDEFYSSLKATVDRIKAKGC